ncbi:MULTISPECIES: hypothetical protein [unclassified Lysobacter]|uniref:hypothetical protein n=1 Tax=unclassified Lysobacter TaxID=2635362 RepID=UPI001BE500D4|nr:MULTISPECIES: hypothetical protein [unclassified Lysobacter]MBT2747533.1 hypothetical protein [Lysobacter sp. ISL-42]MBT2752356.1 hypothetical protein [Lysobacter sp. ISL-50]MBT2776225.1 hypothetical protein [Lysobacter sp. ISL-54]MBT2784309.1 hypothetical protein [Lysobacter sp. ISL-52]
MLDRLNGWQRIGVVATGLWFAFIVCVGALEGGITQRVAGAPAEYEYVPRTPCTPDPPRPDGSISFEEGLGQPPCTDARLIREEVPEVYRTNWGAMFLAAIIPAILAWLLVYGTIGAVRWVAKGFREGRQ